MDGLLYNFSIVELRHLASLTMKISHIVTANHNCSIFVFFSGYLYAHISYLEDDCPACLLLLSTDRNAFFELAETRLKTLEVSAFE